MNTATLSTVSTVSAPSHPASSALHRACLAAKVAADNKGRDILVLDMRSCTPLYDYFVISTGSSRWQWWIASRRGSPPSVPIDSSRCSPR